MVQFVAGEVRLNPEELKAVEDAGKLMERKRRRSLPAKTEFLNITDDY